MIIGLIIPSFQQYDAMGNDVLMMYKVLKKNGFNAIVFAQSYDESIEDIDIKNIDQMYKFLNKKESLLIYHHGVYIDFFNLIIELKCRKIFRYHNVTTPELFKGYDEKSVEMCQKGLSQLKGKLHNFDFFLSCSKFNNDELINNFGVSKNKTFILPPFHRIEEWLKAKEDIKFAENNIDRNQVNILTVGRLSPNKNHQTIIKAFADYVYYYNNKAVLHIVGKVGSTKYYNEIISLITSLNISENIKLYTNGLEENKLKALFLNTDVGLICSKHEGFCVPIVEFMFFSIPIVSSSFTALKDTVGKNGILVDNDDYLEFSISLKFALENKGILREVSKQGYQRYNYESIARRFINYINNIL